MNNKIEKSILLIIPISLGVLICSTLVIFLMQFSLVKFIQNIAFNFDPSIYDSKTILNITKQSYQLAIYGKEIGNQTRLTSLEIEHLKDVYKNVSNFKTFFLNLIVVNLLFLLILKNKSYKLLFTRVNKILYMFIIVIIIALIFFNNFFIYFHNIFFPQGNWEFVYESALIQAYPFSFWIIWFGFWGSLLISINIILSFILKKDKSTTEGNLPTITVSM